MHAHFCYVCLLQSSMLEERDLGVLMAVVTLLLGIVSRNYEGRPRVDMQRSCAATLVHAAQLTSSL